MHFLSVYTLMNSNILPTKYKFKMGWLQLNKKSLHDTSIFLADFKARMIIYRNRIFVENNGTPAWFWASCSVWPRLVLTQTETDLKQTAYQFTPLATHDLCYCLLRPILTLIESPQTVTRIARDLRGWSFHFKHSSHKKTFSAWNFQCNAHNCTIYFVWCIWL